MIPPQHDERIPLKKGDLTFSVKVENYASVQEASKNQNEPDMKDTVTSRTSECLSIPEQQRDPFKQKMMLLVIDLVLRLITLFVALVWGLTGMARTSSKCHESNLGLWFLVALTALTLGALS